LCFVAVHVAADKCTPTPGAGAGPLYKLGVPVKQRYVCDPNPSSKDLYVMDMNWCGPLGICWRRKLEHSEHGHTLVVKGRVLDENCSPISGAELDIWSTDSRGKYGSMHAGEEDGYCRGVIRTGSNGEFEFETEPPGVYGTFTGTTLFSVDPPPYAPAHIHLFLWRAGYRPIATQLYLDNDTSVDYDFRQKLAGPKMSLGGQEEALRLHTAPHKSRPGVRVANRDFVLGKDPKFADKSKAEAAKQVMCLGDPVDPPALCSLRLLPFLRSYILLPALGLVLVLLFWVVNRIVFGLWRLVFGSSKRQHHSKDALKNGASGKKDN